ncbi:hypothetical protein GQ457_08G015560 [Hibiscus cannabinus]
MAAPHSGSLKFNTDGAVNGSFGEGGISGCLRDECSMSLICFSKSVGRVDATSAEILAILEGLSLLRSSGWNNSDVVVFKSDCKIVLRNGSSWCFSVVPRDCNSLADRLAKKGISRLKNYIEVAPAEFARFSGVACLLLSS